VNTKARLTTTALLAVLTSFLHPLGAAPARDYPIQPVPFTEVKLDDAFWAPRIETNRTVTIPYAFGKCEENGRMDNFAIAGGLKEGEHRGSYPFDDTDPYKILEGAAYTLSVQPDPKLEKYLDELIALIAAAQEDDGYLYTCRTNECDRLKNWFGDARWEKLGGSHELYNMGHLYEAATAHYQATGKRSLLNIALKNADLLGKVFGPGKNEDAPGHQVIEMGLVKLYRATGDPQYLKLAKFLLDTRGPGGNSYHQSHEKPYEQSEAVGHAVRASYMYSGMADVAALTGDRRYLQAIDRIWDNVVSKKLYLTGGIGATGHGEAFGKAYELPNETAYCETCAAIGNVMWNHRMFLFHGHAKYIDVLERTLYNGLISGVSLEGDRFFYPNPLASHGQHQRSPWFGCACCPGNIARFVASVPGYVYAQTGDRLYVNLFARGSATLETAGRTVVLTQETQYPWDGKIKLTVNPKPAGRFVLCVRVPGWARGEPVPSDLYRYADPQAGAVQLKVNGKKAGLHLEKGFATLDRLWQKGDVVELDLPMPIHRVLAHDNVEAAAGRVALERGPLVYCAEWTDNEGHVLNLVLPDDAALKTQWRENLLGGVTVIRGRATALGYGKDGKALEKKEKNFVAIPYYAWAHRGAGEMAVWLARDESAAEPATPPGMVRNPSFEQVAGSNPVGWERRTYGGRAQFRSVEGGRTGKRCAMISSESGADAGWLTSVNVRPFTRYRLSAWIKTENLKAGSGRGALLNLHNLQPTQTPAVTGTKDWTRVQVEFETRSQAAIEINCLFGGWGQSTGKAFFDDMALEPLGSASNVPGRPRMYYTDDDYEKPFAKDPDVVWFKGRYLMYYSIRRGSKGIAVGIAQSEDLTNWKKVGEILPEADYERKGLAAPGALVRGGKVHLFYQTYGTGRRDAICHATSDDGLHFRRNETNPIFRPTGDWNCGRAIDADVIEYKGRLLLYCATRDPEMKIQKLVVAAAPADSDCRRSQWKQLCDDSILEPELPWEKKCIEAPTLCEHDGKLYMFYAGAYNNEPQQIGCAVSDDGVAWKRLSKYPLLPNGRASQWNASESGHPGVFVDPDGQMHLFFQGNNDKGASWYLSRMKVAWDDEGYPSLVRPRDGETFVIKETLKPRVTIDAGDTGEPVSKYIYGQFIEHLGRCIYGGIWAEMLEDRKFYYPVTADYKPYRDGRRVTAEAPFPVVAASPWQITGPADSVSMVKEDSFVGEHTPLIQSGGGIAQHDLSLCKDKEYVGYLWLKPDREKTTVRVSLRWGEGPEERQSDAIACFGSQYVKTPLHFRALADTEHASLRIEVISRGACFIGTVSLMPADNVEGMRADTLELLRQLDSPVYRWPGGNFVSGYDWKDGIGDRDRRPPRKNPAWTGVEHNDFGLHEFMRFCELLGTEPYIAVNSGLGGVASAAEQVQYVNGAAGTPMGVLRTKNGHSKPWKVTFWGIGNEMYGGWQLGHMPLEKYVEKHNEFAEAMQKADPSIQLVAVGAAGQWSETMMRHCADHMDLISEHFYRQFREPVVEHVRQAPQAVRGIVEAHRRYREQLDSLEGKDIRIALDEWNYWYGPHVFGELGTRYFVKDALGIAAGLHEMIRNSDMLFMANYAQTVNVIGAIKTTRTAAAFETTGLVLKLYRKHFGAVPVAVEGELYDLDVAAAWTADKKALTIAVVNPTEVAYDIELTVNGAALTGAGRAWHIAHEDPLAYNHPGAKPKVTIKETPLTKTTRKVTVPPYSANIYALKTQ